MFMEYADLLTAAGRTGEATAQLDLAAAAQSLFAANGGTDDLGGAQLAIARNQPAEALRLAMREWDRRQFSDVADMVAWSLHANGRDAEALGFIGRAQALGAVNARFLYHQAVIELAMGDRAGAGAHLRKALELNPHFSPVDAPAAAALLKGLGS
jgi:tetratricopeptide (TPR) repeat protein